MNAIRAAAVPHSTRRQLVLFITIGANTALYFGVHNALRLRLPPYASNASAVSASIRFSFWANRRCTFQFAGAERGVRQLGLFSTIFLLTLVASSAALAILFRLVEDASVVQENAALIGSSGALVLARFWLMRRWVFTARAAE